MKTLCKITFLSLFVLFSCKSENKKDENVKKEAPKKVSTAAYSLERAENSIGWTAYKTTEKIPVKGSFTKVKITSGGEGNTAKEAINGAEFSVPVSSIFTSDSSRDFKIKKFFFSVMENSMLLSGKLMLEDDTKGYVDLTMNGIKQKLPFTYTLENNVFMMNTTMNILDWNAKNALESLNKACFDLHKGQDGVSKTWNDVAISIKTTFK